MDSREKIIQSVISCAYSVAKQLGYGLPKEFYANALAVELRKINYKMTRDETFYVFYDGISIGKSRTDLVVEDRIVVAVTSGEPIIENALAKCRIDLKAADLAEGLIINFGPSWVETRKVAPESKEGPEHWVTDVVEIL